MPDRVTIDMSVPFRSVKEAVALFGEGIIASQVITSQLSKMQTTRENTRCRSSCLDSIAIQLEEAKQEIKREQEKGAQMAMKILTIEEELKSTNRRLKELKDRSCVAVNPIMPKTRELENSIDRKKRHVTFSDPLFAEILNIIVQDKMRDASRIQGKFAR
ncbi:WEB family protein At1g75720-like [Carex rostrata]